jgi:hypothetical protein
MGEQVSRGMGKMEDGRRKAERRKTWFHAKTRRREGGGRSRGGSEE